jgi:Leucine-rich repeat (LRR) protein
LSDSEGELILNQIKQYSHLKTLDLSGNLEFGEKTLIALQRITLLQNKLDFQSRKESKNIIYMFKHHSFLEDNQLIEDEEEELRKEQDKLKEIEKKELQIPDENEQLIENHSVIRAENKDKHLEKTDS